MFRSVVPRLRHVGCQALQPHRLYSRSGKQCSRWVPVWSPWHRPGGRKSLVDHFFNDPRTRQPFRDMERLIERFAGPRFWEPGYVGVRQAGKEVEVKYDNKVFEVKLDVSQFNPEELQVKVTDDRLVISAKHEEKPDDHGYISREFTRQFSIPEDVEAESIESLLTQDGHLIIKGKIKGAENVNERVINIEREEEGTKKDGKE